MPSKMKQSVLLCVPGGARKPLCGTFIIKNMHKRYGGGKETLQGKNIKC